MTTITIDSALGLGLDKVTGTVTFCDEHGRVIGHFTPARALSEYDCPYTEEELNQHLAEALADPHSGKPLSQIWRELEQR